MGVGGKGNWDQGRTMMRKSKVAPNDPRLHHDKPDGEM